MTTRDIALEMLVTRALDKDARVLRELVVGDHIGLTLGFGEVSKLDRRDQVHSELASGQNATVTGYNSLFPINQNRVREAEIP